MNYFKSRNKIIANLKELPDHRDLLESGGGFSDSDRVMSSINVHSTEDRWAAALDQIDVRRELIYSEVDDVCTVLRRACGLDEPYRSALVCTLLGMEWDKPEEVEDAWKQIGTS